MCRDIDGYKELGWSRQVACAFHGDTAGYTAVASPAAAIGDDCYLEVSYVHSGASVGEGTVLSYIDVHEGDVIPPHVVLHGLKQTDGQFVCRIYGVEDNPKEDKLFSKPLTDFIKETGITVGVNQISFKRPNVIRLFRLLSS